MAWAPIPSKWIMLTKETEESNKPERRFFEAEYVPEGLSRITWRDHKSTGTCALMGLMALAVIYNQSKRVSGKIKEGFVQATYEEIMAMADLSRGLISKSLRLLEELGVVVIKKQGRNSYYCLPETQAAGGWCVLPQDHLLEHTDHFSRFKTIRMLIRSKAGLDAMKMYMLFLAFRDRKTNAAIMGYDKITTYTGIRRNDINRAWAILSACQLISITTVQDGPIVEGKIQNYNRYNILGMYQTVAP